MPRNQDQPEHRFFTGSFHPDLEAALAHEVAAYKRAHGPLAPLLLLVPTNLLKVYLARRLAESIGAHANLRFQTLTDLVRALTPTETKPLPRYADELIVEDMIRENVPADSWFGPVRDGAGFRASLLAAIRDLKQADIGPVALRSASRGLPREKFTQLADLYAAYEQRLRKLGYSDEDDLLKLAMSTFSVQRSAFSVRVMIYGFYDFNHLQRQFIAALVAARPVTVFMPYQQDGAFQFAEPTLHWFEETLGIEPEPFAVAAVGDRGESGATAADRGHRPRLQPAEAAELPRTLENLRSGLFLGRDLAKTGEPDPSQLQIISAPGEPREVAEILRESVRASRDSNAPLYHCAVLARTADSYSETIRDAARARGLSVHLQGGESLLRQAAAQAVLLLPRIVADNFRRSTVLEFVSLAPLDVVRLLGDTHGAHFQTGTLARLSAEAGVVAGADSWRTRLARSIHGELGRKQRAEEAGEALPRGFEERLAAARACEAFIQKLLATLESIPAEGAWSQLAAAIEQAARRLLAPSDVLDAALGCVRSLAALEPIRPRVTLPDFIELTRKAIGEKRERETRFEGGGVFVGGLESCRGVSWPVVIVPGLVESSFPRVVREDPILRDPERKRINREMDGEVREPDPAAGEKRLPARLPMKEAGHDEERLLFQLAVESARERLVLTYPRLDPFSGAERVPSIFLVHALEALRGGTATFETLKEDALHLTVPMQDTSLAVVAAIGDRGFGRVAETRRSPAAATATDRVPLDIREHDLATMRGALEGKLRALGPYLDAVSPWIRRGLACERRRWGTPAYTEFDGVFRSDAAKQALAQWCEGRVWPATSLERFARCPFEFFMTDLLGIEDTEDPEEAESIAVRDLGILWHDILKRATETLVAEHLWPARPADVAPAVARAHAVADERFHVFEASGVTGQPVLWEITREKIRADLETWLAFEAKQSDYTPHRFEHQIDDATVLGARVRGRVDRIDVARNGKRWRVFDYKTGKKPFPAESFHRGTALQIPVYMLALEAAGSGVEVASGYYYYITHAGRLKQSGWSRETLRQREAHLREILAAITASIREGRFFLTASGRDAAGVTMPEAALKALDETKQADEHWQRLVTTLEEPGDDE